MSEPAADNTSALDDTSALLWAAERDPRLSSTMSSLVLFDRPVREEAVRLRLDRATRAVPRLRQRVVDDGSWPTPRWQFDPDFDLANHLEVQQCPGEGSLRDTLELAGELIASPLDRERPLFHFVVLHGVDGDRSALLTRVHHALGDGEAMLQLQLEVFDFNPGTADPRLPARSEDDRIEPDPASDDRGGPAPAHPLLAVRDLALGVLRVASADARPIDALVDTAGSALRAVQPPPPLSPVMTGRGAQSRHDVLDLSLPQLRAAGERAGTRINAAFVAGVAYGLGLFHDQVGASCELLRMGMPVSKRTDGHHRGSGNHLAPVRVELPLAAAEPDHLIQIVDALIAAARDEPALDVLEPAQRLLARLPPSVGAAALAHVLGGSDFLTSNLAGSPVPMWLGEARVLAQYPFGPTSAAALNVTLLSYLEAANVGISIDPDAVDDVALLTDCLRKGFDWVVAG